MANQRNMFSDNYPSDEDDFYDAEEMSSASLPEGVRLSKSSLSAAGLLWRNSPNSQSSDEDLSKLEKLEKAEEELIERKKIAEKRLQREEEEIRQRLEKIERKKQAELHKQLVLDALVIHREERGKLEQEEEELMALEAEVLARENEMRRKKVLMLREKLYSASRGQTPNYDNQPCTVEGSSLGASADCVLERPENGVPLPKDYPASDVGIPLASASNAVTEFRQSTEPSVPEGDLAAVSLPTKDPATELKLPLTKEDFRETPNVQSPVQPNPVAPPRRKRALGSSSSGKGASGLNSRSISQGADDVPRVAVHSVTACSPSDCENDRVGVLSNQDIIKPASLPVTGSVEGVSPAESVHSLNIKLATLGRSYVTTEDQGPKVSEYKSSNSAQPKNSPAAEGKTSILRPNSETCESTTNGQPEKGGGANPLALHIMQITNDYARDSISHESDDSQKSSLHAAQKAIKKSGAHLKTLVGKTIGKLRSVADEVLQREDSGAAVPPGAAVEDDDKIDGLSQSKKLTSCNHKGKQDFHNVQLVQTFYGEHRGPVWTMKFSPCGRLLASGGQDAIVRVWALVDAYAYFSDMRHKNDAKRPAGGSAPPSEAHASAVEEESTATATDGVFHNVGSATTMPTVITQDPEPPSPRDTPFMSTALARFSGHTSDILDLSWSKSYFLLSSSMDKTVRLWHMSKSECLCCFQHIDFVTAIVFHPRDERYFLCGSLDGKLRLWNIPEKKVALWNEVAGPVRLITAANFSHNGRFAVVGTYDGRCIFYTTEQFKYFTLINVKSSRGKNARGHKITAIEPLPNEDKILVTSNDSRLRLYDLRDLTLTCKYKGCVNTSSQIKASFSNDGRFIVCGSEDSSIYIWKTYHDFQTFSSARRDRNVYWESIKAHDAVVTSTVFAPQPNLFFSRNKSASLKSLGDKSDEGLKLPVEVRCSNSLRSSGGKGGVGTGSRGGKAESLQKGGSGERHLGEALVTADYIGTIKVLVKPNEASEKSSK